MGRDGLGKQWISPFRRTRKLAEYRTAGDTCRALPSIFDKAEMGRNSHEKQEEQEGVEIESCTGQVGIVPLGQREQTEIRKNLMSHICQNMLPLCLSSFQSSTALPHPWC